MPSREPSPASRSSDEIAYTPADQEPQTQSTLARVPTNMSALYTDPEMRPPIFKSTFQEIICMVCITLAPAASTMAMSCFQMSLQVISQKFNVDGGVLTWSVNSVILSNGACLLFMGGVADALGRRFALIVGFFCFALFSLIAGFMNNYVALCILRALMGACVACATPASAGYLGSSYKDSRRKNMAMSMFALGSPVGAASGLFIAGVCIQVLNWRSIQFFLAIVYGILTVLVVVFLPDDETKADRKHAAAVMKKLDYGGSFISLVAFTLICFALTQVDATTKKWHTGYIIATLVIGIVFIPAFVLYEMYVPAEPIMPMGLFRNANFDICMVITAFSWMSFQGALNYFSIMYFEMIRHYSAIIVACCVLPQTISGVCMNIFAGFTMHRIPGKFYMIVGCLGFMAAAIIWATLPIHRNYFLGPFWAFIIVVTGADFIYNIANRVSLNLVAKNLQSRASGTFNTIVNLSSAVGLGINSAIVGSKYKLYGTPQQNDHPNELWHAIRYAFYFGIALHATSVILSLFLRIPVMGKVTQEPKDEKQIV